MTDGVPRFGETRVGDVANTSDPDPVSSIISAASCEEVVDANCESELEVIAQVGQASVPVTVIGPPVSGPTVLICTIVPPPPPSPGKVAATPPITHTDNRCAVISQISGWSCPGTAGVHVGKGSVDD